MSETPVNVRYMVGDVQEAADWYVEHFGFARLPNASPALIAQASLNVAWAIGIEASLSFLGLGVQPPDASWGTLLQEGYASLYRSASLTIVPAVAIFIAILAFNTFGTQLQRVLDPRQEAR